MHLIHITLPKAFASRFSFLTSNDPITSTQHVHIGQPVTGFNPTGVQSASPETSKDIFYDPFYGLLTLPILFAHHVLLSAK